MTVAASAVKDWLDAVCPELSVSELSRKTGIGRVTLHKQLLNQVPESTVVAISRSIGLSPLSELARFEPYRGLEPSRPAKQEILAFIDWPRLLWAVGMVQEGREFSEEDLGDAVYPDSSRVWVEMIDPGSLRRDVEVELSMASSNVAAALRRTIKLPLAQVFARHAGVPPVSAFVAAGLLLPGEAGWSPDERRSALLGATVSELLQVVALRVAMAEKHHRRIQQFEENLG